jgi:hypothetical protein
MFDIISLLALCGVCFNLVGVLQKNHKYLIKNQKNYGKQDYRKHSGRGNYSRSGKVD